MTEMKIDAIDIEPVPEAYKGYEDLYRFRRRVGILKRPEYEFINGQYVEKEPKLKLIL